MIYWPMPHGQPQYGASADCRRRLSPRQLRLQLGERAVRPFGIRGGSLPSRAEHGELGRLVAQPLTVLAQALLRAGMAGTQLIARGSRGFYRLGKLGEL